MSHCHQTHVYYATFVGVRGQLSGSQFAPSSVVSGYQTRVIRLVYRTLTFLL